MSNCCGCTTKKLHDDCSPNANCTCQRGTVTNKIGQQICFYAQESCIRLTTQHSLLYWQVTQIVHVKTPTCLNAVLLSMKGIVVLQWNVVFLWETALLMSSWDLFWKKLTLHPKIMSNGLIKHWLNYTNRVLEWANELPGLTFYNSLLCVHHIWDACSPIWMQIEWLLFLFPCCFAMWSATFHIMFVAPHYGSKETVLRCIRTNTNRKKRTASNRRKKTSFCLCQVSQTSDPLCKAAKYCYPCK